MGRIALKTVLLIACTLCGAWASGSFNDLLVAGLLIAIVGGSLCEWLLPRPSALYTDAVLAFLTLVQPVWMVFLPVIAFDAGLLVGCLWTAHCGWRAISWSRNGLCALADEFRLSGDRASGSQLSQLLLTLAAASLLWLLPTSLLVVRLTGFWQRYACLLLLVTFFCACCGTVYSRLHLAQKHLLNTRDVQRYTVRRLRSRISNLDEEQAQAERDARLAERTRIAREIHDNVGHLLTRAIMQAQAAQVVAQAQGQQDSAESLAELGETLGQAMTTIRRSVHDLDDEGTDFAAQMQMASTVAASADMDRLEVDLKNDITSAPAPVTRCFVAVIRETLNNTIRHSPARQARVILRDGPDYWQLVVQDDGRIQSHRERAQEKLSDLPAAAGGSKSVVRASVAAGEEGLSGTAERWRGMGLASIEDRASALGGLASSGPNREGWRVFVSLPKEPWRQVDPSNPTAGAQPAHVGPSGHRAR